MKNISVRFQSGRELLNAYWGFLDDGGLFLEGHVGVDDKEGERIVADVRIESLKKRFTLKGRIAKRDDRRTVIAFDKGEGQDLLLNAAWADSHDVPQRKHRRFQTGSEVAYGL